MEYLKVSNRLSTTLDRLRKGSYDTNRVYSVELKFVNDKEMEFYIPVFALEKFESYLSESKMFRLAYLDAEDVIINPNHIIAVLLDEKEYR